MSRRKRCSRDPAPSEILHLCAQLRHNWSETMHRVRAGYGQNFEAVAKRDVWTPPLIDTSELEVPREMAH